jgi:hypothetical protein
MVSKIKTLPQRAKEGALEKEDRETVADSPLAVSPMRPHSSSAPPRSMASDVARRGPHLSGDAPSRHRLDARNRA